MTMGTAQRAVVVAVALLATALLLAGCALQGKPGTAERDHRFLVRLHQAVPNITSVRSNTQLVRLGNAVCDAFDAGVPSLQIADRLGTDNTNLPSQDLGAVMQSAVTTLCPRYHGDL